LLYITAIIVEICLCYKHKSLLRGRLHSRFSSHLTHCALHQTSLAAKEAQAIAPAQPDGNAAWSLCTILRRQRSVHVARSFALALLFALNTLRFTSNFISSEGSTSDSACATWRERCM